MKVYFLSLAVGLLVGIIYSVLNVRSPAPPLVALVGLLGILFGEQIIPASKFILKNHSLCFSCEKSQVKSNITEKLPSDLTENNKNKNL